MNHKVLVDLEILCGGDRRRSFFELQRGETREANVAFPASNRYDRKIKSTQNFKLGVIFNYQLPQK